MERPDVDLVAGFEPLSSGSQPFGRVTNEESPIRLLTEQRTDLAGQLTDAARTIHADNVRVAFLTTQIGKERERTLLSEARQAAA